MIEWSWRIETVNAILCGSFSDEEYWALAFDDLVGRAVADVALFGRLPELTISLFDNRYITSFMTAEGQPQWTIFANNEGETRWLTVENGELCEVFDS
ncbi:hypothetical protein HGP14_07645 [Rhizobium sp. P32RR-XVIII]|uniref:hypothetical protein n=1 Tax=Rhizobium sp. P32RR-XVIII TaxID=2726738 RepID=UPI001456BEF7|nr:hypothetical protein [Rhizobium sp. P32RR-XVIII]NLS03244.1 hypothetical protein [Rhizobium sp. P32RR-XVIII]